MRFIFLLTAVLFGVAVLSPNAVSAKAASISVLHIPGITVLNQQRVIYRCAGDVRLPVRYINTSAGALAYLPAGDKKRLFVSVQAASGVKYVAGSYVWWSKGDTGFLVDVAQDEGGEPILQDCRQVERW